MNRYNLIFLFIFFVGLSSLEANYSIDKKLSKKTKELNEPSLKGLLIVGDVKDLSLESYESIRGVEIKDLDLPGRIEKFVYAIDQGCFWDNPITEENIRAIKQIIIQYYQNEGRPVVIVLTPDQDLSSGVLKLVVNESKLGKVEAKGNRWFTSQYLINQIRLKPGYYLFSDVLDEDIYFLNKNPFRQVYLVYLPGEKENTTDIQLLVNDVKPFRVYSGINNFGNDITGNNQFFLGMNLGNLFRCDQVLSYQYTMSTRCIDCFSAHTVNYHIPLPWRHELNILGGYSHTKGNFVIPETPVSFVVHGFGLQGSMRYDIPFCPYQSFLQDIFFGFDFKRTNNNLEFGGIPIEGKYVNLTQLMVGYNLGYNTEKTRTVFEVEGFVSPGKWIGDQSNSDFQSLRPYAKNRYIYLRSTFKYSWKFYRNFLFSSIFRGQIASNNLLPSEEYGLGGYDTVRGYKERVFNGDNAFVFNLEIFSPKISFLQFFRKNSIKDEFQLLVFFDFGWVNKHKVGEGEEKQKTLMSVGPGVRYQILPYLIAKADWGFQMIPFTSHGNNPKQRLNFSLILAY